MINEEELNCAPSRMPSKTASLFIDEIDKIARRQETWARTCRAEGGAARSSALVGAGTVEHQVGTVEGPIMFCSSRRRVSHVEALGPDP